MTGSKRKVEDLDSPSEEDLPSELGNDLTWRSLLDEENDCTLATYRNCFDDLSVYEAEIKRRILSYGIELKESNYGFLAERLRRDQYPASVYKIEWETTLSAGLKYKDSYIFIEIEKNIRRNGRAEEKLIVDIQFQSQFTIILPSPLAYLNMWNYLPNIFIGTVEKLRRIITTMCSVAEEPIPEHIKPDFLQSKWLSTNRKLQTYIQSEAHLDEDSVSSTDLGNYSSWMSLPIDVKNQRLSNINKFFNDLSKYEAEIMERMLTYKIALKGSNYVFVAERLKRDQYHAHVCTTKWDINSRKGKVCKAEYSFIEIVNIRENDGAEEKLIVDFNFQSQFSYDMTEYQELLSYLPKIFIGTEEKLKRFINLISSEIGNPVPHWITPNYLYTKWLTPNRTIL